MLRRIQAGVLAVAGAVAIAPACSSPEPAPQAPPRPMASSRSDVFIVAPDLPPISAVAVERSRELPEIVRAVHVFAARHPEVLNYMPCFCGCQREGHKHNDDCFVASRNAAGNVTAWDTHGVT